MRIGFIGVGKQAQSAHLPSYALIPECEMAAVADVNEELARKVASRFGIPGVYTSYSRMLEKEKLDAVVLTLPLFPFAVPIIQEVLESGIPLMMEKPMAYSITATEHLVEVARKTGTLMRLAFQRRSDQAVAHAKTLIDEFQGTEEFGPLRFMRFHIGLRGDWVTGVYQQMFSDFWKTVRAAHFKAFQPPPEEYPGLSQKGIESWGYVNGVLCHQINLIRYLLGHPYQVVYADPNGVLACMESEKGVSVSFEIAPHVTTHEWEEHIFVAFKRATLQVNLPPPLAVGRPGSLEIYRNDSKKEPERVMPVFLSKSAMQIQAENFLKALKNEPNPLCTPEEALESVYLCRDLARKMYPD